MLQKKITQANFNGISLSLHPGVVRTQLTRYIPWYKIGFVYLFLPLVYLTTKNSKEGAQTSLYTVLEDKGKLILGEYYSDCQVGYSTEVSKDMQKAEMLWKESQKVWGIKFDI